MLDNLKTEFFFFKYGLVKPSARNYYKEVVRNQFLAVEELEQLNWERTKSLLEYAYANVPYYSETFVGIGLNPNDITKPEHYEQVPVLTRQLLRDNFSKLVSKEARPSDLRISTTGGSTGEPVKVYHQKNVVRDAMGWRMLSWWNLPPDCNWASIYRDTKTDIRSRLLDRIFWWPTNKVLLNASRYKQEDIEKFIISFNKIKPPLLHGYVGAMEHIAQYILDNDIKMAPPVAIWTTSAPLTKVQEVKISKAFGAPVYDQYGCCEVYWLAAECPCKQGLHIFHDVKKIEFLDGAYKAVVTGELGDIAVTDLENNFFPLIRYINGDRGRLLPDKCNCDVNLPLMDKVKGRISDRLPLPSGASINGEYLTTLFDDFPDVVNQFQVIQKSDYSITINYVANPDKQNSKSYLDKIKQGLVNNIDREVPVYLNQVDSIKPVNGKLRFVVSEVK